MSKVEVDKIRKVRNLPASFVLYSRLTEETKFCSNLQAFRSRSKCEDDSLLWEFILKGGEIQQQGKQLGNVIATFTVLTRPFTCAQQDGILEVKS